MTEADPRAIIERAPMSRFQWTIVWIMVALNGLDGFDVLSISFAAPGIAREWGVDRGALGVVLSMELIGMALGSIALGGLADRLGRRRTILFCLPVMALGMIGASLAHDVVTLSVWRVVTGIGIGGMLAVTNAAVAEAANAARRSLCVVLMATGYPIGAVVGGAITAKLLDHADWPIVFQFGAAVTLCLIPIVAWFAPESIAFELQRPGAATLARVNRTLARMGHSPIAALPAAPAEPRSRVPLAELFTPAHARRTILMTIAYFAHVTTFYYLLKWIPKIVVDMGFAPSSAAGVLVWANVGGAIGSLLLGLASLKVSVRGLTIAVMAASVAMVVLFGQGQSGLGSLALVAAATGFFTNAGMVGLYALLAQYFPTELRASATGFAIGVGRGGSALAPALAGLLFISGFGLAGTSAVMALGSLLAVVALALLPRLGHNGNGAA